MPLAAETRRRVIRLEEINDAFSREVIKAGGEKLYVCFQCGTCTASCPIFKFDESYNPRLIIRSAVLGLMDRILNNDMLWLCAACYSCTERCPRGVRPAEVIRAIRNIAAEKGYIHEFFKTQADTIINYGRIWEEEEFVNEMREDMGLPPVPSVNREEVKKILEYTKVKKILASGEGED